MRMKDSIITIKDRVGALLRDYPELRDSDKLLWLAYLNRHGNLISKLGKETYLKIKEIIMNEDMPTMESIRRVRQKYQEEGNYIGRNRQKMMEEANSMRSLMREKF